MGHPVECGGNRPATRAGPHEGTPAVKRKYRFPVSQQANLLGLEWQKLSTFAMTQPDRFARIVREFLNANCR